MQLDKKYKHLNEVSGMSLCKGGFKGVSFSL